MPPTLSVGLCICLPLYETPLALSLPCSLPLAHSHSLPLFVSVAKACTNVATYVCMNIHMYGTVPLWPLCMCACMHLCIPALVQYSAASVCSVRLLLSVSPLQLLPSTTTDATSIMELEAYLVESWLEKPGKESWACQTSASKSGGVNA